MRIKSDSILNTAGLQLSVFFPVEIYYAASYTGRIDDTNNINNNTYLQITRIIRIEYY